MECLSGLSRIMVCTRNDYTKRACHFLYPYTHLTIHYVMNSGVMFILLAKILIDFQPRVFWNLFTHYFIFIFSLIIDLFHDVYIYSSF
jgi:hypothetical protein